MHDTKQLHHKCYLYNIYYILYIIYIYYIFHVLVLIQIYSYILINYYILLPLQAGRPGVQPLCYSPAPAGDPWHPQQKAP